MNCVSLFASADFLVSYVKLPCTTELLVVGYAYDEDEVLSVSRATLVDLSRRSDISYVIELLLGKIEDLSRPFASVSQHPSHILQSESYILSLAADCCTAHWSWMSRTGPRPGGALGPALVNRALDVFIRLLEPIPNDYILPARTLLNDGIDIPRSDQKSVQLGALASVEADCLLNFETRIKVLVEFISASSWPFVFEYFRNTIQSMRSPESHGKAQDLETSALVTLRLASSFWVDSAKLGSVIQEICSSYLHFGKSCQCTIAVVLPLMVVRWIDRYPDEFTRLHSHHKRLDGGADTLFDMTQTGIDNSRRRALLYPMQMTLLLLLPDVFEVASNLREAKSNNLIKKVSFLDNIRKALRNGNERAAYCLITLLRVARHFEVDSDSALVSYAMDVQDEIRDSVFSLPSDCEPTPTFDQDMTTAAFVSLAYLNPNSGAEGLIQTCTSSLAPDTFKIAVIHACSYICGQSEIGKYSLIHNNLVAFIQSKFEVGCLNKFPWDAVNARTNRGQSKYRIILDAQNKPSDVDELEIIEILQYFEVSPSLLVRDFSSRDPERSFLVPFLFCVLSRSQAIRRPALRVAKKVFAEAPILNQPPDVCELPRNLHQSLQEQRFAIQQCFPDSLQGMLISLVRLPLWQYVFTWSTTWISLQLRNSRSS